MATFREKAEALFEGDSAKGDEKAWVKERLEKPIGNAFWAENSLDLKELAEDDEATKKQKKRERREYRKGLLQQLAKPRTGSVTINLVGGAYAVQSSDVKLSTGLSYQTITLQRGSTYTFTWSGFSAHPMAFRTAKDLGVGDFYVTGMTNSGAALTGAYMPSATVTWQVAKDAPDTLYYRCEIHPNMNGTIEIVDPKMEKEAIFKEMTPKIHMENLLVIEQVFQSEASREGKGPRFASKDELKAMKKAKHYFPLTDVDDTSELRYGETDKIVMTVKSKANGETKYGLKKNADPEQEFIAKDDEQKIVRFDELNFALGGVTVFGDGETVTLDGVAEASVTLSAEMTNVHARSLDSRVRVHVNSDAELLVSSHAYDPAETIISTIMLLGDGGATDTITVNVTAPTVTAPTLTTDNLSTVVADIDSFKLGDATAWPTDNDALVDLKFPAGTQITGAHTVGEAASTDTTITLALEIITCTKAQFANLTINAPGDSASALSYQIRARTVN